VFSVRAREFGHGFAIPTKGTFPPKKETQYHHFTHSVCPTKRRTAVKRPNRCPAINNNQIAGNFSYIRTDVNGPKRWNFGVGPGRIDPATHSSSHFSSGDFSSALPLTMSIGSSWLIERIFPLKY
jgi:hypothetical protein